MGCLSVCLSLFRVVAFYGMVFKISVWASYLIAHKHVLVSINQLYLFLSMLSATWFELLYNTYMCTISVTTKWFSNSVFNVSVSCFVHMMFMLLWALPSRGRNVYYAYCEMYWIRLFPRSPMFSLELAYWGCMKRLDE